jgi:hypothetical protein
VQHAWGSKKCVQNFGWKALKGGNHPEGLGIDGKDNIKVGLQEIMWEGLDWVYIVHYRGGWLAFMNI